jgi:hypothetical protein
VSHETNFENLWQLVVITNLSTLLPLPLIGWLPAAKVHEAPDRGGASLATCNNIVMRSQSIPNHHRDIPFIPDFMPELIPTVEEPAE